jgi:hypothetical protein
MAINHRQQQLLQARADHPGGAGDPDVQPA